MLRIFSILSFLLLAFIQVHGKQFPAEGAKLHCTLIGFRFDDELPKGNGMLEIAAGNYANEDSFTRNIIVRQAVNAAQCIAEVPLFNSGYSWRVVPAGKAASRRVLHHFSTLNSINIDSTMYRLRVTNVAQKYGDAFVFLDHSRALFNMSGRPVWFLPPIDGIRESAIVRDLKLTLQGTITFLADEMVYEIDYNGKVLWKPPYEGRISGDTQEHFHHQVTRLSNGHYMTMGNQSLVCRPPRLRSMPPVILDSAIVINDSNSTRYRRYPFGTLIEYDSKGNVLWSWKSSKYFRQNNPYRFRNPFGIYEATLHENSFYFDEKNKIIYLSCKNFSFLLKIKYPEGNVIGEYGTVYPPGSTKVPQPLFCDQHALNKSANGYLYLFNNNICEPGASPQLLMLQEPAAAGAEIKKIWQYDIPIQDQKGPKQMKALLTVGGNVSELPDYSLFGCVCAPYAYVFIVDKAKKTLWSAVPEKWNIVDHTWELMPQYRAAIIDSRKKMEQLIWNSEE